MLTDEQRKRVIRMLQRTWESIGTDILQAIEQAGERPVVAQEDMLDVVGDYVELYGPEEIRRDGVSRRATDLEALKSFRRLPYEEQEEVAHEAFPHPGGQGW